jgi:hypothetical protein
MLLDIERGRRAKPVRSGQAVANLVRAQPGAAA